MGPQRGLASMHARATLIGTWGRTLHGFHIAIIAPTNQDYNGDAGGVSLTDSASHARLVDVGDDSGEAHVGAPVRESASHSWT